MKMKVKNKSALKYFGKQELPPIVKKDDLRYGDIIFIHASGKSYEKEPNCSIIGAFFGFTPMGAVILANLADWAEMQMNLPGHRSIQTKSFFTKFAGGHPAFVMRRMGSFCKYRLPEHGESFA